MRAAEEPSSKNIFDALPEVEKRRWEVEMRLVRTTIRRAKTIPRRDRECLIYCVNLWFHHRKVIGFIYPGAAKVAARLECCIRTAKTILKRSRDAGFLVAVAYPRGGRNATWYAVNIRQILETLGDRQVRVAAEWDAICARSDAELTRAKFCAARAKALRRESRQEQIVQAKETFGDPSDWVEVPF